MDDDVDWRQMAAQNEEEKDDDDDDEAPVVCKIMHALPMLVLTYYKH